MLTSWLCENSSFNILSTFYEYNKNDKWKSEFRPITKCREGREKNQSDETKICPSRLSLQNNLSFFKIYINKSFASLKANACSDGHFYSTGEVT